MVLIPALDKFKSINCMSWLNLDENLLGEKSFKGTSHRFIVTPMSVVVKNDIEALVKTSARLAQ